MSSPARALRRARRAYERAHVLAAIRAIAIAGGLSVVAFGLYRTTRITGLVVGCLALSLAILSWCGGPWRRGAMAGVLAGAPALIVPALLLVASGNGVHCASCARDPIVPYWIVCLAMGLPGGGIVASRAFRDTSPRSFATAATASAVLTGFLGCATIGLGGAVGIALGLAAGGVTTAVTRRTARSSGGHGSI